MRLARLCISGLVLLSACTVKVPVDNSPELTLQFDPVMYVASKAETAPGQYPDGQPFGVSAWVYEPGAAWDGTEATPFLTDARISEQGRVWEPIPGVLWPDKRHRLAFQAYAPYGAAGGIDVRTGVTFPGVDVTRNQTDLLYTAPVTGLSGESVGGVVNLPFRHALCLVDFQLRCNAAEGERAVVSGVSLDGIGCTGSFRSLPQAEWALEGDARELVFFEGSQDLGHTNHPVGEQRWVIPQFARACVAVQLVYHDFWGNETAMDLRSAPLDIPLESGRHYTFSLACALDAGTLKVDLLDDLL